MAANSEVIAKDIPEVIALLSDLNGKIIDANQRVVSMIEKVDSNKTPSEMGVSFLEMKFHLLLSYLINLVQYMMLKANGRPVEDSPTIDRLVELRIVMEKIRPIDQKLKYQIDKLLKLATTGVVGQENDPLRFKPRPENLISKLESSTAADEESEEKKAGVYVPPKVAAMHYDDKLSKRKRNEVVLRKKALSSSLLKELRDEYSEGPEELKEGEIFDTRKDWERNEDEHKTRYEEDNFVRLMSKKAGKQSKSVQLDDLTKFTDLSILSKKIDTDESDDDDNKGASTSFNKKKRKSKSSGKPRSSKKARGSFRRR